ncbi:MAG: cell envelope integrity protein TolA [Gammaproteobacteria bacterium]
MHHTAAASQDRLVTTMFVASLAHGLLIMGVSFSGLLPTVSNAAPSLEVVLVQSRTQKDVTPDEALYLAERSMSGSGTTTEQVRARSQMATAQLANNAGADDGTVLQDQLRETSPQSVSLVAAKALSRFSVQALQEPNEEEADATARARLMRAEAARDELVDEIDQVTELHSDQIRELYVAVNTRQSNVARYLALWKKKIEQVGTLNFPNDEMLNGLTGNPTLEVAIRADGALHDVRVRKSSEHPRIDQSAMRIVRLASPFDPFPDQVKRDYDIMRFVYVWQFVDGARQGGSLRTSAANP